MQALTFTIFGEPTAQGRPRFSTAGGFVKTYDPEKSRTYKQIVYSVISNIKPAKPYDCELVADITAYFKMPKSKSAKWKCQALAGLIRPAKKPDADNIAKIVLDSCNGILFRDDSQIVSLTVSKFYSEQPRVEAKISMLKTGGAQINEGK